MPKTRKERREQQRAAYLDGRASRPHSHTRTLRRSLEEVPTSSSGVCAQCDPVLSRHVSDFKGMVHRGSDLKRRKSINPNPKRGDFTQYRDVVRQNEWLRSNVFDSLGNYLYCSACIRASFGVSKARLTRQRNIKRKECQQPTIEMTKSEVEEERLGQYVLMPSALDLSFKMWWRSLEPSATVEVRYPHARHGNGGKISHAAKTTTHEEFIRFVDMNSQPNGRSADSSGPTNYFSPQFTSIQMPKAGVSHYEERKRRSVVGEFNRSQRESGKGECSNGSSHNWLKSDRPKVAISPHQEDYCDTCCKHKNTIHSKQTTINRMLQSSNADPDDIQKIEDELTSLKQVHESHRQEAQQAHQYYVEVTTRCTLEWKEIQELEQKATLNDDEKEKLTGLKNKFTLVLCADYQMCKLVPYWGMTAQPGCTYYLQKLNHDLFGIVNHGSNSSAVYLFNETMGPKNTDHTVTYLGDYISKLPTWIKRIHLFLDNASSTNKHFYTMAWAMEMVQQGKVSFLRVSFLIAGHTKFSPDLLFSRIAQTYNKSDVFTTAELGEIVARYATVVIDDGTMVCDWRSVLTKYSKLPGIRSLHDFIFTMHPVTQKVVAKVRSKCYEGRFSDATINVIRGRDMHENVIPDQVDGSYAALGKVRELTESKRKHLEQMYRDFIPANRRLPFITIM